MMIQIVVLLAEQDEPAWGQALHKSCRINEASSRHIPDPPGERMIPAQGGLPILCPFAGVRCSDQQSTGEEELKCQGNGGLQCRMRKGTGPA